MKIVVCMKQVPATTNVDIDPVTGSMKRLGSNTRTNPYDFFALETALQIREMTGGTVTVLTMGPMHAESMIKDAYSMGADDAVILSDKKFAGSDVLATSYTLSQGIKAIGDVDLIICGRQTTDGDTAQVGPALAEHLNIPHCAWVSKITEVTDSHICISQDLVSITQESRIQFPCLITVDKDMCVPRLPSYTIRKATKDKPIRVLGFNDLPNPDLTRFGATGSPTSVSRIFAPPARESQVNIEGTAAEKAEKMAEILFAQKII